MHSFRRGLASTFPIFILVAGCGDPQTAAPISGVAPSGEWGVPTSGSPPAGPGGFAANDPPPGSGQPGAQPPGDVQPPAEPPTDDGPADKPPADAPPAGQPDGPGDEPAQPPGEEPLEPDEPAAPPDAPPSTPDDPPEQPPACIDAECDDGNTCTKDFCLQDQCTHVLNGGAECDLALVVQSPERGVIIVGDATVMVTGYAASPVAVVELFVNDEPVNLKGDGTFQVAVTPHMGINILTVRVKDAEGRTDQIAQSFLWAKAFHKTGTATSPAYIDGAAGFWIGQAALDDEKPDLDDLAAIATAALNAFDLDGAIPDPLFAEGSEPSLGWCSWDVTVGNVGYNVADVDIEPHAAGLHVFAILTGFSADAAAIADGACPDAGGSVAADLILLEADVGLAVGKDGGLLVTLNGVDVLINGADVNVTSGAASLMGWLIDWVEQDLANLVAAQLSLWAPDYLLPMIEGYLQDFTSYQATVNIPGIAGGASLPLTVAVAPRTIQMSDTGALISVHAGVGAPAGPHTGPGSMSRSGCGEAVAAAAGPASCTGICGGQADSGCYCDDQCASYGDCCADIAAACSGASGGMPLTPSNAPLSVTVSEDLINQVLYAVWRSGHLDATLSDQALGDLGGLNVGEFSAKLDLKLPPLFTSCTASGSPELQLGDMRVELTIAPFGTPMNLTMYASVRVSVELLLDKPTPNHLATLGIKLKSVEALRTDIVATDTDLPGLDSIVEALLTDTLIDTFAQQLIAQIAKMIPIPVVQPGNWVTTLPQDLYLTLDATKLLLTDGTLVLSGAPIALD